MAGMPLQAALAAGYGGKDHAAILKATKTPAGSVDFFVELHIEQGPLLEQVGVCSGELVDQNLQSAGSQCALAYVLFGGRLPSLDCIGIIV